MTSPDMTPEEIEALAKKVAHWHGQKLVDRVDGVSRTVAARSGYGSWGHSAEEYAKNHWREYDAVAQFIAETIREAERIENLNYQGAMADLASLLTAVIARINGEKDMASLAEYIRANYPDEAKAIRAGD